VKFIRKQFWTGIIFIRGLIISVRDADMEKGFDPQIRKKKLKIATLEAGIRSIRAV
jgi:hypothetical protein